MSLRCCCALLHLFSVTASVVNNQFIGTPYKSGVLRNTESLSSLSSIGCSVCHVGSVSYQTTSTDIASCKGPYLFVGALSLDDSTFLIGTYALATDVQMETDLNCPHISNGVYWYFTPRTSFGFLENPILSQTSFDLSVAHPVAYLSWTIDGTDKNNNLRRIDESENKMTNYILNCPGLY